MLEARPVSSVPGQANYSPKTSEAKFKQVCSFGLMNNGLFSSDPLLDYTNMIHFSVKQSERFYQPRANYLSSQPQIGSKQRQKLINWLIVIQTSFKLLPETLFISVNIIDRFLSKEKLELTNLQLLSITALSIASKFQEIYPPVTADFIKMTDNSYTVEAMRQMETKVLSVIEFDINCTPSQTFLEHYSRGINVTKPSVLIYASFLLDLALLKDEFLQFKTSDITVCALIIAMSRESKLTGRSFDAELHRLDGIRGFENFDDATL